VRIEDLMRRGRGDMTNNNNVEQAQAVVKPVLASTSRLHPHAKERCEQFLRELHDEVPLGHLADEDFTTEEIGEFVECVNGIVEWLGRCREDAGEGSLMVYPYSTIVNYDMNNLKKLLKTANERNIEKAQRTAAEKERQVRQEMEKKRRQIALYEINPPYDDANIFLTEAELELFLSSLRGAVDGYLDEGKNCLYNDWQFDARAGDYVGCLGIIKRRKEEDDRRKRVQLEHDRYIDRLSLAVEKVKADLAHSKKPAFDYPGGLEKYRPDDGWCDNLQLPTREQIENWSRGKVLEMLPEILTDFVNWNLSWKVLVLPRASYEVNSVPSLRWHFDGLVLVTVTLELKPGVIEEHHKGNTGEIQANGQRLGVVFIGPHEWTISGTFSTPVALIRTLAEGGLEAPGISVTEHWPPFTTFSVQGLEEEVEVCDDFIGFIRDISKEKTLVQALLERELVDGVTVELLEKKWGLPLPMVSGPGAGIKESTEDEGDLVAALEALGLKKTEITALIEAAHLPSGMPLEDKVKAVLKNTGM